MRKILDRIQSVIERMRGPAEDTAEVPMPGDVPNRRFFHDVSEAAQCVMEILSDLTYSEELQKLFSQDYVKDYLEEALMRCYEPDGGVNFDVWWKSQDSARLIPSREWALLGWAAAKVSMRADPQTLCSCHACIDERSQTP